MPVRYRMTNPTSINLLRASWTVPDTDTIQPVEKPNLRFPKGTNDYPETNKVQLKSLVSTKIPPEWGDGGHRFTCRDHGQDFFNRLDR
jgi:hypothetical protein